MERTRRHYKQLAATSALAYSATVSKEGGNALRRFLSEDEEDTEMHELTKEEIGALG